VPACDSVEAIQLFQDNYKQQTKNIIINSGSNDIAIYPYHRTTVTLLATNTRHYKYLDS